MASIFFLKGLIVAYAMGVPIGPIGVLCIRKTLAEGPSRGLIIGLGAATADALLGSIAAFGFTFVSDLVASQQSWIHLGGGGVLLIVGFRTFRTKREGSIFRFDNMGFVGSYVSIVLLGLTNPMTIFAFIAVFALVGLGHTLMVVSDSLLVLGVFTGSALWFLTLCYVASLFRNKLALGGLKWVNRISGVLIILSGVAAFVSLI